MLHTWDCSFCWCPCNGWRYWILFKTQSIVRHLWRGGGGTFMFLFHFSTILLALWLVASRQFRSVHFKVVFRRSEKPICATLCLSEVPPVLPLEQFQCWSDENVENQRLQVTKARLWEMPFHAWQSASVKTWPMLAWVAEMSIAPRTNFFFLLVFICKERSNVACALRSSNSKQKKTKQKKKPTSVA